MAFDEKDAQVTGFFNPDTKTVNCFEKTQVIHLPSLSL